MVQERQIGDTSTRDAAPQPGPLAAASLLGDLAHVRGASRWAPGIVRESWERPSGTRVLREYGHEFQTTGFWFGTGACARVVAGDAAGRRGLFGRCAGRRRRLLGLARIADVLGAAVNLDCAQYRPTVQSYRDPTGQPRLRHAGRRVLQPAG